MLIQQKLFKSLNVVENTSRILMKKYVPLQGQICEKTNLNPCRGRGRCNLSLQCEKVAKREKLRLTILKNYLINVPFSTFSLQRESKFSKELTAYSLQSEKVLKGTFIKLFNKQCTNTKYQQYSRTSKSIIITFSL